MKMLRNLQYLLTGTSFRRFFVGHYCVEHALPAAGHYMSQGEGDAMFLARQHNQPHKKSSPYIHGSVPNYHGQKERDEEVDSSKEKGVITRGVEVVKDAAAKAGERIKEIVASAQEDVAEKKEGASLNATFKQKPPLNSEPHFIVKDGKITENSRYKPVSLDKDHDQKEEKSLLTKGVEKLKDSAIKAEERIKEVTGYGAPTTSPDSKTHKEEHSSEMAEKPEAHFTAKDILKKSADAIQWSYKEVEHGVKELMHPHGSVSVVKSSGQQKSATPAVIVLPRDACIELSSKDHRICARPLIHPDMAQFLPAEHTITGIDNLKLDYAIMQLSIKKGAMLPLLTSDVAIVYYVLGGKGSIQIENDEVVVEAGQVAYISPHVKHMVKNMNNEIEMRLLCIPNHAWQPEALKSIFE